MRKPRMRVAPPVVLDDQQRKTLEQMGQIALVAHPSGPAGKDHPVGCGRQAGFGNRRRGEHQQPEGRSMA